MILKKEFVLDLNNICTLGKNICDFFCNNGQYVVIKNYNNFINDKDITDTYEKLNNCIGKIVAVDLVKDTYKVSGNIWADVKYEYGSDEKQFWRSSNHQNLHTDNTFCEIENYGNLTQLVCFKPCEYSGNTTIISNDYLIELIKYVDKNINTNLYEKILNKEIYHSAGNDLYLKRKILEYNSKENKYIFCYNYFPAIRGKNTDENLEIIKELNLFLEEKIMLSNLMDEVKLNRGDALIFNDERVLHGRKSFIGTRHYKKCAIQINDCSIYNFNELKLEKL